VFADRREPETTPVYFKSKFLPRNQVGRERQIEFESALAATGLFERDASEPKWPDVKAALGAVGAPQADHGCVRKILNRRG
jgi:hypothetical protein